ncbi:hypothetical protein [Streptomyces sp. NPDC096311]
MSVRAWGVHCDAHLELAAVSHLVYEPGQLLDVADGDAAVRQ